MIVIIASDATSMSADDLLKMHIPIILPSIVHKGGGIANVNSFIPLSGYGKLHIRIWGSLTDLFNKERQDQWPSRTMQLPGINYIEQNFVISGESTRITYNSEGTTLPGIEL